MALIDKIKNRENAGPEQKYIPVDYFFSVVSLFLRGKINATEAQVILDKFLDDKLTAGEKSTIAQIKTVYDGKNNAQKGDYMWSIHDALKLLEVAGLTKVQVSALLEI